ncbi:MAG: SRPBCC domain-containing protein [Kofleriaceae bacterium]|nr:SRPBCC domain-containing protein [Kofleriaceae bacterium]MBP6836417.1 SRPBCC domain-containing protein [Kofleriaceae bacterium]
MSHDGTQDQGRIVIERSYRASIDDVWALWTTKDGFESWWGPQGFRVEVHELDARVGGALRYDMIADAPEMVAAMKQMGAPISHPTRSRFTEVAHHRRLVLTNLLDFLPGVAPYESHIDADFTVVGDRVRMVLTLDRLHDADWTERQQQGMTSQLGKLDTRFAAA